MTDSESINNTTTAFLIILNTMNCGIVLKMKLVPKLFGLDLLLLVDYRSTTLL